MVRVLRRRADFFRRFLAAGAAALVFALGVFSAIPVLHDWLHGQHTAPAADTCAVVLFADGVALTTALTAPPPSVTDWAEPPHAAAIEVFLDSPRYLLRPERGPPAV